MLALQHVLPELAGRELGSAAQAQAEKLVLAGPVGAEGPKHEVKYHAAHSWQCALCAVAQLLSGSDLAKPQS